MDSDLYTSDLVRPSENESIENTVNQVNIPYLSINDKMLGEDRIIYPKELLEELNPLNF